LIILKSFCRDAFRTSVTGEREILDENSKVFDLIEIVSFFVILNFQFLTHRVPYNFLPLKSEGGQKPMEHISYHAYREIPPGMAEAALKLVDECAHHDGTREIADIKSITALVFNPDISLFFTAEIGGKLAGIVALFVPTPDEAELAGFVSPLFRKQGIFTKLRELAKKEVSKYGIPVILYVCNEQSVPGIGMLSTTHMPYDHTEQVMELPMAAVPEPSDISLRLISLEDLDELVSITEKIFNESRENIRVSLENTLKFSYRKTYLLNRGSRVFGMGHLSFLPEDDSVFLYGFGILPEIQGQGFGRKGLLALIREARRLEPDKPLLLEVDSANGKRCLTPYPAIWDRFFEGSSV